MSPPNQNAEQIARDNIDTQFEVFVQNERDIDAAPKRSEALRQTILKNAFIGQLVPQDPSDETASALLERILKERNNLDKATKTGSKAMRGKQHDSRALTRKGVRM